jgi:hypothetical protein
MTHPGRRPRQRLANEVVPNIDAFVPDRQIDCGKGAELR